MSEPAQLAGSEEHVEDDARQAVIDLSARLETLWSEACVCSRNGVEPRTGPGPWDEAAELLGKAMSEIERVSARVDPTLGRRDWQSRLPRTPPVDVTTRRTADPSVATR